MNKVELLAPAGNLEKLKIAISYGADAVYIGGKKFSLRARASNFDLEDIKEAVRFAALHNAKVYVTMNITPHNDDLDGLEQYLHDLEDAGVSAIIVTSMYIASVARRVTPKIEIHFSTQLSSCNHEVVNYLETLGATRVVLGRELSLDEIASVKAKTAIELEVFIHGGMCVSFSGRCMLSNYMTRRDANRGGCAHSCRWNYQLLADEKQINPTDEYFNMGSKDLCAINAIPKLISSGVASLKIEGRMKTAYYIATVVRTYRMLIDEYYRTNGKISDESYQFFIHEIAKAENRQTSDGFLTRFPSARQQLFNVRTETPTKEFVGYVLDYDELTKISTIEQRNYFKVGDKLEFFGPNLLNTTFTVEEMFDEDMNALDVARHPQQIIKMVLPFKVQRDDMIRLVDAKENS